MDDKILDQFEQQEAENLAFSVKLNRWSLALITHMIAEQEQKLLASGQPVEPVDDQIAFWEALA